MHVAMQEKIISLSHFLVFILGLALRLYRACKASKGVQGHTGVHVVIEEKSISIENFWFFFRAHTKGAQGTQGHTGVHFSGSRFFYPDFRKYQLRGYF